MFSEKSDAWKSLRMPFKKALGFYLFLLTNAIQFVNLLESKHQVNYCNIYLLFREILMLLINWNECSIALIGIIASYWFNIPRPAQRKG